MQAPLATGALLHTGKPIVWRCLNFGQEFWNLKDAGEYRWRRACSRPSQRGARTAGRLHANGVKRPSLLKAAKTTMFSNKESCSTFLKKYMDRVGGPCNTDSPRPPSPVAPKWGKGSMEKSFASWHKIPPSSQGFRPMGIQPQLQLAWMLSGIQGNSTPSSHRERQSPKLEGLHDTIFTRKKYGWTPLHFAVGPVSTK